MHAGLHLVHRDAHGLVGTYDRVVLFVIHDAMTEDLLSASVRANRSIAPRYPNGVASLTIANVGIRFPTAAERAAAAEAIAAVRDNTRCAAQYVGGDGFWASAARSVVTAIEMMSPDDRPRRTFGKLSEATAWMAERMEQDVAWARAVLSMAEQLPTGPSLTPASAR